MNQSYAYERTFVVLFNLTLEWCKHTALPFRWLRNNKFWRYNQLSLLGILCFRAVCKVIVVSRPAESDDL